MAATRQDRCYRRATIGRQLIPTGVVATLPVVVCTARATMNIYCSLRGADNCFRERSVK